MAAIWSILVLMTSPFGSDTMKYVLLFQSFSVTYINAILTLQLVTFFLTALTAQTAQTEEFMFKNVVY
jgi:hypothetical protein